MEVQLGNPADEIKRLRRCVNDLVSVLALPAIWAGSEPTQIVNTLLDALLGMLNLDLIYVQLEGSRGKAPVENLRFAPTWHSTTAPQETGELLKRWVGKDQQKWSSEERRLIGDTEISIVSLPLGLHGDAGLLVAGSRRKDFPRETERLVLSAAANQAAIGLKEAWLLDEQKRLTNELDERVVQRTIELADANEALREEMAERQRADQALQVRELNLRLLLDSIPAPVAVMAADGRVENVNHPTLEYFGKPLEDLKRWGTSDAVHPDDLPHAIDVWRTAVETGRPYDIKERLRRFDGVYRWFGVRGFPLQDSEGHVLNWCVLLTDIDDRERAEEALRVAMDERTRLAAFREEIGIALSQQEGLEVILNSCANAMVRHIDAAFARIWTLSSDGRELELQASAGMYTRLDGSYSRIPLGELKIGLIAQERKPHFTNDVQNDIRVSDKDWARREEMISFAGYPLVVEHRLVGVMGMFSRKALTESTLEALSFVASTIAQGIERKRAEEALRASERNLSLNINAMPTLLASARPDGWGDFFNQGWMDYTGLSAEQLQGWGWATPLHPDDAKGLLKIWRSSLASGAPLEAEARMRRFDGAYRWHMFRANAMRDESGAIVKWYGNAVDIEQRKQNAEKLRQSEAFLAEGQRLSSTGSFYWRVGADEITFSDETYRIFELEQNVPLTHELIHSRVHPEDLPAIKENTARFRQDFSSGDFQDDFRLLLPDGSIKYIHVLSHRSRDESGQVEHTGTFQDVTQRRLAEEALADLRSELAQVARITSLAGLTASIAHEVNQPLSGVVTNASTCLRMLGSDPPNVDGARETARRALRDGNRASEMITRLRALFSKKQVTTELLDLNEATREVIALSLSELQRNRVLLQADLDTDLPVITGNRVQLQQVILNLLRNASDAMSAVQDRPRHLVIRTERDAGEHVRLTVQDVGVGFDPDAMGKLFQAFYTTKDEGMGMGLSISRSIIESHQGRLWAIRNDGPGATFCFSLPCGRERAMTASPTQSI
jgi:PAS domain S-box-containing protein